MAWLPRNPKCWLGAFIFWFLALTLMSSTAPAGPPTWSFPHIDKVLHFGYFLGGGGLFSAFLFRRKPERVNWGKRILVVVLVLTLVGASDEFHQSFTPGRSGNDPYDLLADVLGATAGTLLFMRIHHWLK